MWHPNAGDLHPEARAALDEAYRERERIKCSRGDFVDGYLSALVATRQWSAFAVEIPPDAELSPSQKALSL